MKIQAMDIQAGDRIVAYCNNKMQICTVRHILEPEQRNITLSVSTSEHSRNSISRVVRFQPDALVELQSKCLSQPNTNEDEVSQQQERQPELLFGSIDGSSQDFPQNNEVN